MQSDNGLILTSSSYTTLVKSYGLQQEFTTEYSQAQNCIVEHVSDVHKKQCVYPHRFETLLSSLPQPMWTV